jgi:hypothetical protein
MEQLSDRDSFTGDKIYLDSDNLLEGTIHRFEHAAQLPIPAGIQPDKGIHTPFALQVARLAGISIGSAVKNQDALKMLYDFKEKQKYQVNNLEDQMLNKVSQSDYSGAVKLAVASSNPRESQRVISMMTKLQHPVQHAFRGLSIDDRRRFILSLSDKDRHKFFSSL